MTAKGELIDQLYSEELLWLDRADAREAIETVLGHVIATLRADRRISARTLLAWEEFFVDAVNRAADDLQGPHDWWPASNGRGARRVR